MSAATLEVVARAESLRVQIESVLTYPNPAVSEEHERSRLLRCGISLSAFTALEDYLKKRFAELTSSFSRSLMSFGDFPSHLKEALTIGALENAQWNLDGDRRSRLIDPLAFAQNASGFISSTKTAAIIPYADSFAPSSHNTSWTVVERFANAVLLEKPADTLNNVGYLVSGGVFSPKDYLKTCLERRNAVAHVPWMDVAHGDLRSQVQGLTKFCCVVDLAISWGVKRIISADSPPVSG